MNALVRGLLVAQWAVIAGMFVAAAILWPSTPEQLALHWDLSGQVNGYGTKAEGLLVLPIASLIVAVLLEVLPRFDPHRERYVEFAEAYAAVRLGVVVVLAGVYAMVLLWAHGVHVSVALVVAPLVGALLVLIGAVLGQVKPNWFFGIRTPWTLSSERAWTATHQAGRWVFVAMGVSIALAGVLQAAWAIGLAMVVCLCGVLGLIAYSYVVWRTEAHQTTVR